MLKKRISGDKLESIPNVGPAVAAKLRLLGFNKPNDLKGADPYAMHQKLLKLTGKHHDPCLLDVFISAVSFCRGNPPKPRWKFTAMRKRKINKQ